MNINEELKKIYNYYWDEALKVYKKNDLKISNPLLLKIDEEKLKLADKVVMICGQETYGWWEGEFGDKSIDELMSQYDGYLHNTLDNMREKQTRAFWKGFKWWEERIQKEYPNENIYCIWNNLVKIGKENDVGMTEEIRKFENNYFHTLKEEIDILKPDMIVFFSTDPKRDIDFKTNLKNFLFNHDGYPKYMNKDQKYKTPLRIESNLLDSKMIRLYHPSYFGGFYNVNETAFQMLINKDYIIGNKENIEKLFWKELFHEIEKNFSLSSAIVENNDLKNQSIEFKIDNLMIVIKRTWNLFLEIENQQWKYITFDGIQNNDERANNLIDMRNGNKNFWQLANLYNASN